MAFIYKENEKDEQRKTTMPDNFNPTDKDGNKMVHPSNISQKLWDDWVKNLPSKPLPDGIPCSHHGCLDHVTHPCEGCGRIAGMTEF